jgi:hypothetical protein
VTERPGDAYSRQLAAGRGPAGSGRPMQNWTPQDEYLGAFAHGTSDEPGRAGLEYGTKITPEGGGRWHRNDAGVTE